MDTFDEMSTPFVPGTERQRRALRNAIARRRLEEIREEKVLHQFITEVWDQTASSVSPGG